MPELRRLRPGAARRLVLGLAALVIGMSAAGCSVIAYPPIGDAGEDDGPWKGDVTWVVSEVPKTVAPGQTVTIDVSGTTLLPTATNPFWQCIGEVAAEWSWRSPTRSKSGLFSSVGKRTTWIGPVKEYRADYCGRPLVGVKLQTTVPADATGQATLALKVSSLYSRNRDVGSYYVTDSRSYTATVVGSDSGGGTSGANPVARIFPHNAPTDIALPGLVDARLSTDPNGQALSYSWDLNGDGQFGDPTDGDTGTAPGTGLAYVSSATMTAQFNNVNQYQTVAVKVTTPDGRSGSTSTRIRMDSGMGNGSISASPASAAPGATVTLTLALPSGVYVTSSNKATACLDTNGDGVYGDAIVSFTDRSNRTVAITANSAAGYHQVGAVFWSDNANQDCARRGGDSAEDRYTSGFVKLTSNAYQTSGTRSSRQGAAATFVASATLRLNPRQLLVRGKPQADGSVRGSVIRGVYTFRTPATAKKVKRPAALARFTGGTYVARTQSTQIVGSGVNGKMIYSGRATALLRGRDGSLACVTSTQEGLDNVIVMVGGTGPASRLTFTTVTPQPPFALSPPPTTGKKTKPKARPTRAKGTVTATTGTKARGLNGTCRGLVRYLR